MNFATDVHDIRDIAEAVHDLIVESAAVDGLSVSEWAAVRRILIEDFTVSIEADKALGHDVG